MRPSFRLLTATFLLTAWTSTARAYEDQVTLGVAAGYGHAFSDVAPAHGALGALTLSSGLDEVWSWRVSGVLAHHPNDGSESSSLQAAALSADLVYAIDIVELVPYAGLGLGALGTLRDQTVRLEPTTHAALGIGYWLDFDWLLELETRAYLRPLQLGSEPVYWTVMLSAVVVFDD